MGLGNGRDYKTNTDRVNRNMAIHKVLLDELTGGGMDRLEADNTAYKSLTSRDEAYRAACKRLGLTPKARRK